MKKSGRTVAGRGSKPGKPSKATRRATTAKKSKRAPDARGRLRRAWVTVPDPACPGGPGLRVPVPAHPDRAALSADATEAAYHVRTLRDNARISRSPKALPPGATHTVERSASGNKVLVRKRFSAV